MKRIFFISVVVSAMIFFGFELNSYARINFINDQNTTAFIHYQVNIHPDWKVLNNSCLMVITITNEAKTIIGSPQVYINGVNTYNFYETGPVSGTRIATMTNASVPGGQEQVCQNIYMMSSKSGNFQNGSTYPFDLYETSLIGPDKYPTKTE